MQTLPQLTTSVTLTKWQHPLKVIALGDSLVYGYGDPVGGGWVEQLRRYWMMSDESGHILYNLGIRGDRCSQVAQRLEQEFRQRGELKNKVPDLIILSVGVNDTPRLGRPDGRCYTDLTLFSQQITDLLDQAQSLCPVLFVGMIPVNEKKMPFLDCFYFNHTDQYQYKEVTQKACLEREIPYLDIFDQWMSRGLDWINAHLMEDGLHPNIAGYRTLWEEVVNWQPIANLSSTPQR